MSRNILMQVVFSIVVLWVATHFTRQAKAQATNGIISGTVTDASGAAVPGVTIQVKNVNTGVTRTVLTNEQGRYRVPDLLVGAYEVQGALPGFQTVVQRGIPLTVGSERVVDFSLQVGQPETTVTVEGEIAQVDTTSTAIASLIEQKQIADLPLNGRNYTHPIGQHERTGLLESWTRLGRSWNDAWRRSNCGILNPDEYLRCTVWRRRRRDQCCDEVRNQSVSWFDLRVLPQQRARRAGSLRRSEAADVPPKSVRREPRRSDTER